MSAGDLTMHAPATKRTAATTHSYNTKIFKKEEEEEEAIAIACVQNYYKFCPNFS